MAGGVHFHGCISYKITRVLQVDTVSLVVTFTFRFAFYQTATLKLLSHVIPVGWLAKVNKYQSNQDQLQQPFISLIHSQIL